MRLSPGAILFIFIFVILVAAGVFWFAAPQDGIFTFGNSRSASAPFESDNPREEARADRKTPVDIHIPPSPELIAKGGTIRGRIRLEPADAPVPHDMVVSLRPSRFQRGNTTAESRDLTVDATNGFRADGLKFGSYEVRARAGGWSGSPSDVKVNENGPFADVTIRMHKNPDVLGFVRDPTRAPLEAIRVEISGRDELGANVYDQLDTAADGSFKFKSIADGDYSISAGPAGNPLRPPLVIQIREGGAPTILIDVPAVSSIEIRAAVHGFDVPIDGVLVTMFRASAEDASVDNAITGTEGKVIFKNLPAGKYIIRGSREYFRPANTSIIIEEGRNETVDLKLLPLLEELMLQFSFTKPLDPIPQYPVFDVGSPAEAHGAASRPPK